MSGRNSGIAGALSRLGDAFVGALALGMALTAVFIHVDRTLNPGNPDAGQWGVLGVVIGLPLGFAVGWLVAPHKHARRAFLASTIGAFIGGLVGGYIQPALALILMFVGFVGGWLLARWWAKSRAGGSERHSRE